MTASPALDYLDYAVAKACDCVAAGKLAREQDKTATVPARHNPLVVVGPSGCGKSQWLKNFFHLWRKRSTEKAGLPPTKPTRSTAGGADLCRCHWC